MPVCVDPAAGNSAPALCQLENKQGGDGQKQRHNSPSAARSWRDTRPPRSESMRPPLKSFNL